MWITFNWYNGFGCLPEPVELFELTRRIDWLMKEDPNKNWNLIQRWARPMNQLSAGLFFNMTGEKFEDLESTVNMNGPKSDELKLNMMWIGKGYIRIKYDVTGEIK